nr:hypothetical protein [Clostridiales bacterium]
RNYDDGVEYIGLGLCCEAAAALIIDRDEKFSLIPEAPLPYGIDLINGISEDIAAALDGFCVDKSCSDRAAFFLTLEILDGRWEELLKDLKKTPVSKKDRDEFINSRLIEFRNLLIYFLYRHKGNRKYAAESCRIIAEVCVRSGLDLKEISRMYSAEVEYSDVNTAIMEEGGYE